MKLIPAIDLINGKCVRLTKGAYDTKKEYHSNPTEVALNFEKLGITHLHLVDLDGAKQKKIVNAYVLEQIKSKTNLTIDFGGGLHDIQEVEKAFDLGASYVTLGSMAAKYTDKAKKCIERFGADKIILGADFLNEQIAVSAWSEQSNINLFEFVQYYMNLGVKTVICTDISKDGMLQGPSTAIYQKLISRFDDIKLIASGGVSSMQDVYDLQDIGCHAVILGKAIYENKITPSELQNYCNNGL